MGRMFFFLCLIAAVCCGLWMGGKSPQIPAKVTFASSIHPARSYPVTQNKSFVFIVYAYNQSPWCERALHSIFEQEYEAYRVILVDDGSVDGTVEKMQQFILDNQQEHRVLFVKNEHRLGPIASLYRMIDNCQEEEVILPLEAKDWLAHPQVLQRLNATYQNPDVWCTLGQAIRYPSYEIIDPPHLSKEQVEKEGYETLSLSVPSSFYAGLFKQIQLQDLFQEGEFAANHPSYLTPLLELAGGRMRSLFEPIAFENGASSSCFSNTRFSPKHHYAPLAAFPKAKEMVEKADILLFSYNRPLQLYACLESIQRYVTGTDRIYVLYRASDEGFSLAYEQLKKTFPEVRFVSQGDQPKKDFKPWVNRILFQSPAKYVLFGVDDLIVKDFVDLKQCIHLTEKAGAYGFYLRFGRHIRHCYQMGRAQAIPESLPIGSGIYVWDVCRAELDWGFPNNLDMTLYRKADLKEAFQKMKFNNPNGLESNWARDYPPKQAIGLYFEQSKVVNIPLNIVTVTGNPHMNYLTPEELLVKFNQNLKIDIDPLYQIENPSPHYDYIPQFVER